MPDYLLLMHNDARAPEADWAPYLATLQASGGFTGGSAIGQGVAVRKAGTTPITARLTGFIRLEAADLDAAQALLTGNPVYESGGTIEIRELPETD